MNEPASELCRFYNYLLLEDSLKIIRPYTTLVFFFSWFNDNIAKMFSEENRKKHDWTGCQ